MTDDQLSAINSVARKLAPSFVFGAYDKDDIEQEARLAALEALPKYDPDKGDLEPFLYRHAKFRLLNLVRKEHYRAEPPAGAKPGDERWQKWEKRNETKKNLSNLTPLLDSDTDRFSAETQFAEAMAKREILQIIDDWLPVQYRSDYLRLVDGARVPAKRLSKLLEIIKEIVTEHYDEFAEAWSSISE